MRTTNRLYSLLLLAAASVGVFSCTKTNTINNGQVIETPYSLYFSDTAGTLYNSTDGKTSSVVFAADGAAARSIFSMNKNLLTAKHALYVSTNNGRNFNNSYSNLDLATYDTLINIKGRNYDLNQSMAIFVPAWNHGYIVSRAPTAYFGFAWNENDGVGGWTPEDYMDTNTTVHTSNVTVTSFTLLKSGVLVAYDGLHRLGFTRQSLGVRWQEIVPNDTALGVPGYPSVFSLGHINNRLILIDNYGSRGAYYSDNQGASWTEYAGYPANTPLTCVASPFEQLTLVGTDSSGLYTINANTNSFEKISNGLPANLVVRNIAYKENVFKNGRKQQYIYLATNQGIYESSDLGANWTRTIPGNFVAIY